MPDRMWDRARPLLPPSGIAVLGLFPTVMLLFLFVTPLTAPLGFAVGMLIDNALSVTLLQYAVMPTLTRLFRPWLSAAGPAGRATTLAGVGVIALLLAALAAGFRQVTG